ncbi:hypothetical protein CB1_000519025 [Camelus ferus]|nr:hypothetical protein CB1_000519025 [Camelus ferus]
MPVWPQGHGWAQVPWLKAAFFLFLFLFSPKESCLLEDMHLFGHYPAHDDFYLVVCSACNQVVKPQVFQSHCEGPSSGSSTTRVPTALAVTNTSSHYSGYVFTDHFAVL